MYLIKLNFELYEELKFTIHNQASNCPSIQNTCKYLSNKTGRLYWKSNPVLQKLI